MTRRHVEAIAAALEAGAPIHNPDMRTGYQWAAIDVANALQKLNPSFDRARFLRDCGVN